MLIKKRTSENSEKAAYSLNVVTVRNEMEMRELEEQEKLSHCWERQNLITIRYGGKIFDIYKCKYCGITGKRYWKNQYVTPDSEYKSDKYLYCQR